MDRKHTQAPTKMIGGNFSGVQSSHKGLRCLKEKQFVILSQEKQGQKEAICPASLRGSGLRAQSLPLPAIPMSHPLHDDVTPSSPQELPQKNSCKHPNPQGNVKYYTMAVEPESLPCGEWFQTARIENCLSNQRKNVSNSFLYGQHNVRLSSNAGFIFLKCFSNPI